MTKLLDIDECATSGHSCHAQATCSNTQGSYSCMCNPGYNGDGTSCQGMLNTILLADMLLLHRTNGRGGGGRLSRSMSYVKSDKGSSLILNF